MQDSLGALLAIGLLWLVIKFAFGASSASSSANAGAGGAGGAGNVATGGVGGAAGQAPGAALAARDRVRNVPNEMVTTVQSMFPHVSAAAIRYDLARSGSVEITCDRILSEGGLPAPPAGLFGTPGVVPPAPRPAESASTSTAKAQPRASSSLISRFGLEARLQQPGEPSSSVVDKGKNREDTRPVEAGKNAWAESADARQRELRRRKEEMILAARRRLEAKAAASASTPTS